MYSGYSGLKRPEAPPSDWQWFSICSAHQRYKEDCSLCNRGRWINEASDYQRLLSWLWRQSPRLWQKWANGPEAADDRAHLEEIFPNLKGTHIESDQRLSRWQHLMHVIFG